MAHWQISKRARNPIYSKRFWLKNHTPRDVLATLEWRSGMYSRNGNRDDSYPRRYVDVNYYGETDKNITLMELRYGDWIHDRELLTYTVEGDDGLSEL